jgi:hypothetical protein
VGGNHSLVGRDAASFRRSFQARRFGSCLTNRWAHYKAASASTVTLISDSQHTYTFTQLGSEYGNATGFDWLLAFWRGIRSEVLPSYGDLLGVLVQ